MTREVPEGAPLAVLQRIRATRGGTVDKGSFPEVAAPGPGERCELCAEPVDDLHGHLVDLQTRRLLCACRGCHLLFTSEGAGGGHFRAVPDRYQALPGLQDAAAWEALQIPVGVAFFFINSELARVAAFYPGPAGATESELALDTWEQVAGADAAVATLQPDVEAVIVRCGRARHDTDRAECYIVPIDTCYELVGHLRRLWKGFDGGSEARAALDGFFDRVRGRAR